MKMLKNLAIATVAAGTMLAAASPAQAVITTFASFSPIGSTANVRWTNSNGSVATGTGGKMTSIASATSTVLASRNVQFSFLGNSLSPFFTNATAAFTLNAIVPTGNPATLAAGFLIQEAVAGSFSFTTTSAVTIGSTTFAAGSNLLSATFGNTAIAGQRNGNTASFAGSTAAGDTLVYTSDFLSFTNVNDSAFAISLDSLFPGLQAVPTNGTPTRALRNFTAVASGTFSTDPAPIVTAIPEPAVWGLMIVGFGMVGIQTRRRSRTVTVVA